MVSSTLFYFYCLFLNTISLYNNNIYLFQQLQSWNRTRNDPLPAWITARFHLNIAPLWQHRRWETQRKKMTDHARRLNVILQFVLHQDLSLDISKRRDARLLSVLGEICKFGWSHVTLQRVVLVLPGLWFE